MGEILYAVIFGAVQGLTEFLPVSSSGHLVLAHSITDFRVTNELAFDVTLHLGTLTALIVYFRADLARVSRAGWEILQQGKILTDDQRLAWWIALATIPAVIAGVILESAAETTFRSDRLVAVSLIVAGIVLWIVDRQRPQNREIAHLGWWQAVLIGVGQAIALIPGVSRSGATMTFARFFRLDRASAARFSFVLAVPIMIGAGGKSLLDLAGESLPSDQLAAYVIGGFTAAVVGYAAIRFLLRFVVNHSFGIFALYRLILGVIVLLLSYR